MRSLWQDLGPLENSLYELQKVGAQLGATCGYRRYSSTGVLYCSEIPWITGT